MKLVCPKCGSDNINQYRMMTGKIWCSDCNYTEPQKEIHNPFVVDDTKNIKEENEKSR